MTSKGRPVVVLSILERDAPATLRRVEAAPAGCGLLEIRADRLRASEVAGIVARANRPALVTVRRREQGGWFDGSEDERESTLLASLEAGAVLVDAEWGTPLADLASGPMAQRVVVSHHGARCRESELVPLYRAMAATKAARLKIVPEATAADQAGAVRDLLRLATGEGRSLACFAQGPFGVPTRLLAPSWGSWGTYGAIAHGQQTAEGQLTCHDLLEVHDVLGIRSDTRRFGIVGRPVDGSPSPAMHSAAYRALGIDARYLPIEAGLFDELHPLTGPDGALGLEAAAVTVPFKEEAARRVVLSDPWARASRSVNTVRCEGRRWRGYNTDAPAAISLIRRHLDPTNARVALVGAGGTARGLAAALRREGAKVVLFNRDRDRGLRVAEELGVAAEGLQALASATWDILVQATPLGRGGEEVIAARRLNGRLVLDVVYGPEPTPLVSAARARGLWAIDGFELLLAQAVLQFELMTGKKPSGEVMAGAGRSWLAERSQRRPSRLP